ncbi:MAG: hypothetical protein P1V51_12145 [Deltaproteobacteria bacterium]|nr:hypothetical protein [Deltaproteobacteria bacterium]
MNDAERQELQRALTKVISETNGVSLGDTLELATHSMLFKERPACLAAVSEFRTLLFDLARGAADIEELLAHPVGRALEAILRSFPAPFHDEHTHLTGALEASFIFPRLKALLEGPEAAAYERKIVEVYGEGALPIRSEADVDRLIRLRGSTSFGQYLQQLTLAKLVLRDREAHADAAYSLASTVFGKFNVGKVRLKFSLSRATSEGADALPGDRVSAEDVVLGLYEGFMRFQREEPRFDFVLSPSFRKEASFFDSDRFATKQEDFLHQVKRIFELLERHPFLREKLSDVDTVGDERDHYRKSHFEEMRLGFRKLQFAGFRLRSHHGETWRTLRLGVQAVDNAMNIWHIDTLEHGVSLGVNPNFYFHMIFEKVMEKNFQGEGVAPDSREGQELAEMDWSRQPEILDKLLAGEKLSLEETQRFIKIKFHTAREVEHYQHDVLNRMIHKEVSLVALPSSNIMLTSSFPTYKDHPFSWWEKKAVKLGVGTDNYVTLDTNFVREMVILLCTDMEDLKITKLLMIVTGETRRPVISRLLWSMRTAS